VHRQIQHNPARPETQDHPPDWPSDADVPQDEENEIPFVIDEFDWWDDGPCTDDGSKRP
jgi:hypothetical protein